MAMPNAKVLIGGILGVILFVVLLPTLLGFLNDAISSITTYWSGMSTVGPILYILVAFALIFLLIKWFDSKSTR